MPCTIGLDFGTNSVRCLIVDTSSGNQLAADVFDYPTGDDGIILDGSDHNLARQNPADYLTGMEAAVKGAIAQVQKAQKQFDPAHVIGIGVDTTGSTPIPLNEKLTPLCMFEQFKHNLNAYAWLWKETHHPEYLAKCGGTYSSEWFFSKLLHCRRCDPAVFDAAYTWLECADYIPAVLTGKTRPDQIKTCRCAAGHKAMFNDTWGGLPAKEFLAKLDPKLAQLRDRLYQRTYTINVPAGNLSEHWAQKLGLKAGIPVAVAALDAHLGAVGSGIGPGKLVKIIGTSSCDILVCPNTEPIPNIPGLCGIVDGSVLPGYFGLEAGQSAVGDIFNWFVNYIQPGGAHAGSHQVLTEKAAILKPGQSGLLALDWNNGNRTILVDPRLTGLLIGQTLHTKPEEIYRALIEATAFGALTIINRFEDYGINVTEVINCGGIAEKNPLIMQIYADVTGREMKVSGSAQSCALGSAIAGAVAAGKNAGGYDTFPDAQNAMCSLKDITYKPIAQNQKLYQRLYTLYSQLHDAFGLESFSGSLAGVMKELLNIKDQIYA